MKRSTCHYCGAVRIQGVQTHAPGCVIMIPEGVWDGDDLVVEEFIVLPIAQPINQEGKK